MQEAKVNGGSLKVTSALYDWNMSDDYLTKLSKLSDIQRVVKSDELLSEDTSALHSILIRAVLDDSSQQVKDKGAQLCTELVSKVTEQYSASKNRLEQELKESSQNSSALLAGLCQPPSRANSNVKLCFSDSLHDPVQSRVRVQQTVYVLLHLQDEWRDSISSQQVQLELGRRIQICCTLPYRCDQFRVSSNKDWLVCELTLQCPGACQVHLQLGNNVKNVIGKRISFEVEIPEKPAYLLFTEALEFQQKVHSGDEWIVNFEIMSNLGKPWKCKVADVVGKVCCERITPGDIYSISGCVEACPGNHHDENEENSKFKMTLKNNNMPRGLYRLVVSVQCAGEAVMVDSSPASFLAHSSRDPRKWSAEDVIIFIRQYIDVPQNVLRGTDNQEVEGRDLTDSGCFYLRDWLGLAPSQSDFKEKMQRIEVLMSEIKSLDTEARFAEGPHKVLLEDCIKKRDVEIDPQLIGAGGSAEVFKGVWKDRIVAVKMPRKGQHVDLAAIKALHSEMRRMQSCTHKNVVVCYGLMVDPCTPISAGILMELCSGSLVDLFAGGRIPSWNERLNAALDAARGLKYLHSLSIIHRDVKPQNLLIAPGGVIKV